MPARLSAFLIWALVAASAMFWGLRLFVGAPAAPAHTLAATDMGPGRVDLTRLFGAPPVPAEVSAQVPALASRFQLSGVMAPKEPGDHGVALIAVDGKMPRAFRVGALIDSDLVLQTVSRRTASIGPAGGAAAVVLELPVLPPPSTGSLPPAPAFGLPGGGAVPPIAAAPSPVAPVAPVAPMIAPRSAEAQDVPEDAPARPPRRSRGPGVTPRDMQSSATE
jgi:general secretion pathway protein C